MPSSSLERAISKLAAAGEKAGITVEQMISMLDAGVGVEALLQVIFFRLGMEEVPAVRFMSPPKWIM